MYKFSFFLLTFILLFTARSYSQEQLPLWPEGKMPNSKGLVLKDSVAQSRLYQVGTPRLYLYPASPGNNTGAAILIVPGGGYVRLAADYDNFATARFYQEMGINAFVVCHRLPTSPDLVIPHTAPLEDIQRAIRMIRANATSWSIDPQRIGVSGTSAGGHGASTLSTHREDVSAIGDQLDAVSFRPDFAILVSPVITFTGRGVHKGSRDRLLGSNPSKELLAHYSNQTKVTKDTPPTLMIHADNDRSVHPFNSIVYYQALKDVGVSSSLHIFPYGGHSISIGNNPGSTSMWPEISLEWLREMKFID